MKPAGLPAVRLAKTPRDVIRPHNTPARVFASARRGAASPKGRKSPLPLDGERAAQQTASNVLPAPHLAAAEPAPGPGRARVSGPAAPGEASSQQAIRKAGRWLTILDAAARPLAVVAASGWWLAVALSVSGAHAAGGWAPRCPELARLHVRASTAAPPYSGRSGASLAPGVVGRRAGRHVRPAARPRHATPLAATRCTAARRGDGRHTGDRKGDLPRVPQASSPCSSHPPTHGRCYAMLCHAMPCHAMPKNQTLSNAVQGRGPCGHNFAHARGRSARSARAPRGNVAGRASDGHRVRCLRPRKRRGTCGGSRCRPGRRCRRVGEQRGRKRRLARVPGDRPADDRGDRSDQPDWHAAVHARRGAADVAPARRGPRVQHGRSRRRRSADAHVCHLRGHQGR